MKFGDRFSDFLSRFRRKQQLVKAKADDLQTGIDLLLMFPLEGDKITVGGLAGMQQVRVVGLNRERTHVTILREDGAAVSGRIEDFLNPEKSNGMVVFVV